MSTSTGSWISPREQHKPQISPREQRKPQISPREQRKPQITPPLQKTVGPMNSLDARVHAAIDADPARPMPKPAKSERTSFELLRTRDKAPPMHFAAFVLSSCAGCTNAAAMLGAVANNAIGVSHVTGSATKVGSTQSS